MPEYSWTDVNPETKPSKKPRYRMHAGCRITHDPELLHLRITTEPTKIVGDVYGPTTYVHLYQDTDVDKANAKADRLAERISRMTAAAIDVWKLEEAADKAAGLGPI